MTRIRRTLPREHSSQSGHLWRRELRIDELIPWLEARLGNVRVDGEVFESGQGRPGEECEREHSEKEEGQDVAPVHLEPYAKRGMGAEWVGCGVKDMVESAAVC